MLHSVFFALMVGSPPTHPYWPGFCFHPPTTPAGALPPPIPPPFGSRNAPCACSTVQTAQPHLTCIHCLLEAAWKLFKESDTSRKKAT